MQVAGDDAEAEAESPMQVVGDDAEAEAAEEGDAGVGPSALPVFLAELELFLSFILIIVDALQLGGRY